MASADPSPAPTHRRLRRLGVALITLVVALGGFVLLLLFFQGRDHSQLSDAAETAQGPGQLAPGRRPQSPATIRSDRPGTRLGEHQLLHALELGDVVLLYGTQAPPAELRALQERVSGPFDPVLAANGAAVVLAYRPGTDGVTALAWRHELRTPSAADPALAQFADYWLGRGAP